jgi:hypothetical protein
MTIHKPLTSSLGSSKLLKQACQTKDSDAKGLS